MRLDAIELGQKELKQSQEDLAVLLPVRFQDLAKRASVEIVQSDQQTYVGIGFFLRPNLVITANHNLLQNYRDDDVVFVRVHSDEVGMETVGFKLKGRHEDYDIAVLYCCSAYKSPHVLQVATAPAVDVPTGSTRLAITTFSNAISEQCRGSTFPRSFGVLPATLTKRSDHHLLYSSNLFSGDDSGAALIHAANGKVIGIHLETVNEANEALRKEEITIEKVAESVNSLVSGLSQGFIGLRLDILEVNSLLDE